MHLKHMPKEGWWTVIGNWKPRWQIKGLKLRASFTSFSTKRFMLGSTCFPEEHMSQSTIFEQQPNFNLPENNRKHILWTILSICKSINSVFKWFCLRNSSTMCKFLPSLCCPQGVNHKPRVWVCTVEWCSPRGAKGSTA